MWFFIIERYFRAVLYGAARPASQTCAYACSVTGCTIATSAAGGAFSARPGSSLSASIVLENTDAAFQS
jgi:hypothetical protein